MPSGVVREVLKKLASIEELQAAVLGVPGVVGAVVAESASGPPTVRVWTDDSRDPDHVQREVRALVVRAHAIRQIEHPGPVMMEPVPKPKPTPREGPDAWVAPRRSGLGKGLQALLPEAREERAPAHLISIDLSAQPSLDMIAIEESASGVTVRAVDTANNIAEAKVIGGSASVNPAIVAAVAELIGELPPPRLVSVELRDTEVAAVLVVTLELTDTTVAAGAAVVQGGMPFTLGKAAWAAIRSVRP